MDGRRFDRMVTILAAASHRRGLLQFLLALAGLIPLLAVDEGDAGKGASGRKGGTRHRRNRRRHARRRNKKKTKQKKACTPQSPAETCAGRCGTVENNCRERVDCGPCDCDPPCEACQICSSEPGTPGVCLPDPACEPCSAHSECGQNALCLDGRCQPCTVTCDSDADECGAALQTAIAAAAAAGRGEILVCPGRYGGNFVINAAVTFIGAGDGDDPARDTILDAQGVGRAVEIAPGGPGEVLLAGLRITGGGGNNFSGGGIFNRHSRTLTMTRCTVSGNSTANPGDGGGIRNDGTLTLRDCRIENNSAADRGGGIFSPAGSTRLTGSTQVRGNTAAQGGGIFVLDGDLTIEVGCRVTANTAQPGQGGGIFLDLGTVALESDQIVTNNSGGNCAGEPILNCEG